MNPDREPSDLTDPTLDALLRAHSDETPSPDVDAAILAAAHRAVQSTPRDAAQPAEATSPWRWWMPITAAAVIGAIAIGVLQLIPKDPESTATVVSDTPARGEPASAPKPTAPSPPIVAKREAQSEAKPAASPEPFPAQRRDAAPRVPEKRLAAPPAAAEQRAPAAPAPEQGAAAAAGAIAKQSGAALDTQVENPAQRIARIRQFFGEGKLDEAARELNAFRAAYPDADERLPDELRAWAATVRR